MEHWSTDDVKEEGRITGDKIGSGTRWKGRVEEVV